MQIFILKKRNQLTKQGKWSVLSIIDVNVVLQIYAGLRVKFIQVKSQHED